MKISRIVLALTVLLIPLVLRSLWFYQGRYSPAPEAQMPDFSSASLAFPELSTSLPTPKSIPQTDEVVLFDQLHGNLFSFSEITSLMEGIQSRGANWAAVENDADLAMSLKRAESFVVIAPTLPFNPAEIAAVKAFTDRGGRLLVITDPTRNTGYSDPTSSGSLLSMEASSVSVSNLLLNPYDISFDDDYLYNLVHNEGNFRHILFSDFTKDALTQGLKQVAFYSAHSLHGGGKALVSADDQTFSSLTDAGGSLSVAALSKDGQTLALGDLTFLASPYAQVADNQKLIQNLAAFLVESPRPVSLADFPYLFQRDVAVLHDEELDLTADMVAQIANLQSALRNEGHAVNLSDKKPAGSDLLVIGLLPPSKDIEPWLKDFKITFETDLAKDFTAEETPEPAAIKASTTPTATLEATETVTPAVEETSAPGFDVYPSFDELDVTGSGGTMDIPGFGKLPTAGLNLILFQPSGEQTSVILLADTEDAIGVLLTRLNSGDLSGCLIKGNIAVCGSSTDGGFSGGVG